MAKGQSAAPKKHSSEVGCFLFFLAFLFILAIARSQGISLTQLISDIVAQFGIHNTG
jgi:hypothetical protein